MAVSKATIVAKRNPRITAVTTLQNGAFTQKYSWEQKYNHLDSYKHLCRENWTYYGILQACQHQLIKPFSKINKYFCDPAYTRHIPYPAFEKDRIPVSPSYFHPASRIYRPRIPHPASILSLIPHPAKPMLTLSVEFDPILESHLLKEGIATLFVGDLTHHTPLSTSLAFVQQLVATLVRVTT